MDSLVARPGAFRSVVLGMLVLGAWLLITAMPVAADGGPHVSTANSGATTLTADGCAGCHRAHTAQGEGLLVAADDESLCLTCHGATTQGATTDVETGIQYGVGANSTRGPQVAALRSGGFVEARIDSTHVTRISYDASGETWFSSLVPARTAPQAVTSAHLQIGSSSIVEKGVAWGNYIDADGATNSTAGPVVDLSCTACHNPHGNGLYRILNPIPTVPGTGFVAVVSPKPVTDLALPTGSGAAGVRNYTIRWGITLADVVNNTYPDGTTNGDYWRRWLPWNGVPQWNGSTFLPATGRFRDIPMYAPPATSADLLNFKDQITRWCSACHTRYDGVTGADYNTGDAIYTYRHDISQSECTQCHVSHGSNAGMQGDFSGPMTYPDGSLPTSVTTGTPPTEVTTWYNSRLLKIDNRGTCQQCHDPTGTIANTNVVNSPPPSP